MHMPSRLFPRIVSCTPRHDAPRGAPWGRSIYLAYLYLLGLSAHIRRLDHCNLSSTGLICKQQLGNARFLLDLNVSLSPAFFPIERKSTTTNDFARLSSKPS
jgi:hypothetical protein